MTPLCQRSCSALAAACTAAIADLALTQPTAPPRAACAPATKPRSHSGTTSRRSRGPVQRGLEASAHGGEDGEQARLVEAVGREEARRPLAGGFALVDAAAVGDGGGVASRKCTRPSAPTIAAMAITIAALPRARPAKAQPRR